MNLDHFGMDTITLAGPLEAKLTAMRDAGFTQVMLNANDLAGHPGGPEAAGEIVRRSGLRVTGFQVLRDFEGFRATSMPTRWTSPRRCSTCAARSARACCSAARRPRRTPPPISGLLTKDLQKLAMLAVPYGIRIAYEALSWGRHVNEYTQAWEIVAEADRANLGLAIDSFHIFATGTSRERLEEIPPAEDLPGAARRLHVAADPLARGAHRHRAALPRVPRRRCAQRGGRAARAHARHASATAATTASKCSTTTTPRFRSRSSPSAPAAR